MPKIHQENYQLISSNRIPWKINHFVEHDNEIEFKTENIPLPEIRIFIEYST